MRIDPKYFGIVDPSSAGTDFPALPVGSINYMSGHYWPSIETSPGVFDFSKLDPVVQTATQKKVRPILVLGFSPSFHSASASGDRRSMPEMAAWRTYVTNVVTRYRGKLDYQIWPEPSQTGNWIDSPADLALLQRAAYNIIKSVDRTAQVAGPATVLRFSGQKTWFKTFYRAKPGGTPVSKFMDVMALDPYPLEKGTPEDMARIVRWARVEGAKLGVRKPIWTLEINYGVPPGGVGNVTPYVDSKQIAYLQRTMLLSPAEGVKSRVVV